MFKTKERMEIVARLYSTNIMNDELMAIINATEGGFIRMDNVRHWAKELGLERDPEAIERQRSVSATLAAAKAKEAQAAILARQEVPIPYTPDWPYERVQRLIELWRSGHRTRECALQLGCTTSTITGKVHRLVSRGILLARGNPVPSPLGKRWATSPIDALILAEREKKTQHWRIAKMIGGIFGVAVTANMVIRRARTLRGETNMEGWRMKRREHGEPRVVVPRPRVPVVFHPVIVDFRSHAPLRVARVKPEEMVVGSGKCRFPLWAHDEAPTHEFCEKPAVLGESWCPACRRIVFSKGAAA